MKKGKSDSKHRALAQLENPYAFAGLADERTEAQANGSTDSAWRHAYRESQNPQALDFYSSNSDEMVSPAKESKYQLSKKAFRKECSAIFRAYMPALERHALRPVHNAFISRNEDRSPEIRHALVEALRPYDVRAEAGGLASAFNREEEPAIAEKLAKIERAVIARFEGGDAGPR